MRCLTFKRRSTDPFIVTHTEDPFSLTHSFLLLHSCTAPSTVASSTPRAAGPPCCQSQATLRLFRRRPRSLPFAADSYILHHRDTVIGSLKRYSLFLWLFFCFSFITCTSSLFIHSKENICNSLILKFEFLK